MSLPVTIRLPAGVELAARVEASDGDTMLLVLTVPEAGLRPAEAVVEWLSPTGIHRVSGRLEPAGPEAVRLRRRAEAVEQRRAWARADAVVPIVVTDPQTRTAHTTTLNVSAGGALIVDPIGLRAGTPVDLELRLDGAVVRARAVVAREAGEARGLEIVRITPGDREQLVRFVRERERLALRVRPGGRAPSLPPGAAA